jgi:hypothetical protein
MGLFSRGIGRCALLGLCALAWACIARAEDVPVNLLKNPGFEQYDKGLPVEWDLFVQPQEGSSGLLDRGGRAAQGRNAILLSTEKAYEKEPFNNWNQNILQDFTGKTLVVKGAIRSDSATDASIWVQCWKKNPWTLLASKSSASVTPVKGTADWTRVEVRVTAPRGTEYATVRCVLLGTGKAWFDDLSLTTEDAKPAPPPPTPAPAPTPALPARAREKAAPLQAPKVDPSEFTLSSLMGLLSGEEKDKDQELTAPPMHLPIPPLPPRRPTPELQGPAQPEMPQVDNKSLRDLMNASKMLMESYQALKQTNADLSEQVKKQQQEIQELRSRRQGGTKSAAPAPAEPQAPETAPPLVPSTKENQ